MLDESRHYHNRRFLQLSHEMLNCLAIDGICDGVQVETMKSQASFRMIQVSSKVAVFSSPEPLGSQGELIVYPSSRRPSVRRPSYVHHFQDLLL